MCVSKRLSIVLLILCVSAFTLYAQGKVLLILKDGSDSMELMLRDEVGVMRNLLRLDGYQTFVATESGNELGGSSVYRVKPDFKIDEVDMSQYVGLMVPCMALGIGKGIVEKAVELVKQAYDMKIPIAAEQGGVEFLARAGILKGKHFSMSSDTKYIVPDGIYDGNRISEDGLIITAGTCPYRATTTLPSTTFELTKRFIASIQKTGKH